jgi:predicted GIY-YIG superfamily endonuclease
VTSEPEGLGEEKPTYYYVCILQSKAFTDRFYTGFTENIEKRLKDHNTGKNPHTKK